MDIWSICDQWGISNIRIKLDENINATFRGWATEGFRFGQDFCFENAIERIYWEMYQENPDNRRLCNEYQDSLILRKRNRVLIVRAAIETLKEFMQEVNQTSGSSNRDYRLSIASSNRQLLASETFLYIVRNPNPNRQDFQFYQRLIQTGSEALFSQFYATMVHDLISECFTELQKRVDVNFMHCLKYLKIAQELGNKYIRTLRSFRYCRNGINIINDELLQNFVALVDVSIDTFSSRIFQSLDEMQEYADKKMMSLVAKYNEGMLAHVSTNENSIVTAHKKMCSDAITMFFMELENCKHCTAELREYFVTKLKLRLDADFAIHLERCKARKIERHSAEVVEPGWDTYAIIYLELDKISFVFVSNEEGYHQRNIKQIKGSEHVIITKDNEAFVGDLVTFSSQRIDRKKLVQSLLSCREKKADTELFFAILFKHIVQLRGDHVVDKLVLILTQNFTCTFSTLVQNALETAHVKDSIVINDAYNLPVSKKVGKYNHELDRCFSSCLFVLHETRFEKGRLDEKVLSYFDLHERRLRMTISHMDSKSRAESKKIYVTNFLTRRINFKILKTSTISFSEVIDKREENYLGYLEVKGQTKNATCTFSCHISPSLNFGVRVEERDDCSISWTRTTRKNQREDSVRIKNNRAELEKVSFSKDMVPNPVQILKNVVLRVEHNLRHHPGLKQFTVNRITKEVVAAEEIIKDAGDPDRIQDKIKLLEKSIPLWFKSV